jgi:drug/metabolite transporter (DMT)-like permease
VLVWAALVGSALCSGTAVILQAIAARRLPDGAGLRRAGALLRSPAYLLALVLVVTGFVLAFAALRSLPVFVVQAGRASSLAVAALLAVPALGARLRLRDWCGLAALGVGLVGLAFAVMSAPAAVPGPAIRLAMVTGGMLLAGTAWALATRTRSSRSGLLLAVGAGLGYALLALGARVADLSSVLALLADPAAWAAGLGGLLGLGLTVVALRRAPVVAATAATVATETAVGALLGVVLAGDRAQPGLTWLAVLAFLAVLGGALTVADAGTEREAEVFSAPR